MSDRSPGAVPPLRPLLPASPSQSRSPQLPQRQHFGFKRKRQPAACEPCRDHKTKCDGGRPKCEACVRRDSDCRFEAEPRETHVQALKRKYDLLQEEASELQRVYNLMRTRPGDEALSIFHRLRGGVSPAVVLQHVYHGDLLIQLSLATEPGPRYEASSSRRVTMSSSAEAEPAPSFDMSAHKGASSAASASEALEDRTALNKALLGQTATSYLLQYSGCEVVEPLIDRVQASRWTAVTADDEATRRLLRLFFQLEYRWFSVFHKDYFLQDMASGNEEHCSSLLVNAVLACACHASRRIKHGDHSWSLRGDLGPEFFAEARQLWESEQNKGKVRLTTIQAGLLLNLAHGIDGVDTVGWQCTTRSLCMAEELGLFEPRAEEAEDARIRHARVYTAWSAFCWQSLWCYQFFVPPLVKHPPPRPLPDPDLEPNWYGEIHVRYPAAGGISPIGHGHLFKAKAEFLTTLNNLSTRFHLAEAPASHPVFPEVERDRVMTG